MKKIIIGVVIGLIVGAISSPILGMAVGATRSLILGMAPDEAILTLADKIDQESGRNDAQQQAITELNAANEQNNMQLNELTKSQEIALCNEKKNTCESKINAIGSQAITLGTGRILIGNRQELINKIEGHVEDCKKTRDSGEFKSQEVKNAWERCIENGEKEIAQIKSIIASEGSEKAILLSGECKNYQNPCE